MSFLSDQPFDDTFNKLEDGILKNLNCIKIGEIHSFNSETQTAEVMIHHDKEGEFPLLSSCPVFILSGGSGSIQFPIKKGDDCLILFNDNNFGSWFHSSPIASHTRNTYTPPTHNLSNAIALVGIKKLGKSIKQYSTNSVKITGDKIELGDNALKGIARKGDKIDFTGVTFTGSIAGQPASGNLAGQATILTGSNKVFSA